MGFLNWMSKNNLARSTENYIWAIDQGKSHRVVGDRRQRFQKAIALMIHHVSQQEILAIVRRAAKKERASSVALGHVRLDLMQVYKDCGMALADEEELV